jgi:hypothetical protein
VICRVHWKGFQSIGVEPLRQLGGYNEFRHWRRGGRRDARGRVSGPAGIWG